MPLQKSSASCRNSWSCFSVKCHNIGGFENGIASGIIICHTCLRIQFKVECNKFGQADRSRKRRHEGQQGDVPHLSEQDRARDVRVYLQIGG